MDCDFSPSSPHLLPNGLFSPQNRISFELLALSGLSGFSTFKGGKMLIFQGFANSRIVREFPPFSFKVRIATLTRNQFVLTDTRVRIPPSPPKRRTVREHGSSFSSSAGQFEHASTPQQWIWRRRASPAGLESRLTLLRGSSFCTEKAARACVPLFLDRRTIILLLRS